MSWGIGFCNNIGTACKFGKQIEYGKSQLGHHPFCYCKFGNFRKNYIFANNVKRHICDVLNSQLRHDLPISVTYCVFSPLHDGFIF